MAVPADYRPELRYAAQQRLLPVQYSGGLFKRMPELESINNQQV